MLRDYFELMGFGPDGWGRPMLIATAMTLAVASCGFFIGAVIGTLIAWAKISRLFIASALADAYTTILRGIPDILVILLFYFGGSAALSSIASMFGATGFVGVPAFVTGALAIGVISGAYQAEVFRGAYSSISKGEVEAGISVGMHSFLIFRRIIAPQVLRFALPGLGNMWQVILKESALISVAGLVELTRQSDIGARSTQQPFSFYITAGLLYLIITSLSSWGFRRAEVYSLRGTRRAI